MLTSSSKHVVFLKPTSRSRELRPSDILELGKKPKRPLPDPRSRPRAKEPVPYTWRPKIEALIKAGLEVQRYPRPPAGEFTLSVREPFIKDNGHLHFIYCDLYQTWGNRAEFYMNEGSTSGLVSIFVDKNTPGRRLVIDVAVTPGTVLTAYHGEFSVTADKTGHALVVATADELADVSLHLKVLGGRPLYFYFAVITPLP